MTRFIMLDAPFTGEPVTFHCHGETVPGNYVGQ
jgi:hypothetical protein